MIDLVLERPGKQALRLNLCWLAAYVLSLDYHLHGTPYVDAIVARHAQAAIDADLLALDPFRDIPIVTPAAFVQGSAR